MKHPHAVVVGSAFALVGLLSGCAPAVQLTQQAPASSQAAASAAASSVTPTATPSASVAPLALKEYSQTDRSPDGFTTKVSIRVAPVMLGTDPAALDRAWAAVGGSGTVPCTSGTPDYENPNFTMNPELTGYAFGTITMTNETTGFAPKDTNYLMGGLNHLAAAGFGFTNGSSCKGFVRGFDFSPQWTSNVWGPVPIVFAVYDYRSPTHPNGDPSKLDGTVVLVTDRLSFRLTAGT